MKSFLVLLLVAAAQAAVLNREARDVESIPAPELIKLSAVDPLGFKLDWNPVKSESDPIVGYKVKVWEQPKHKIFKYEIVNGVKVLVEEYVPAKFPVSNKVPSFEPKEIIVTKANENTAQSTNLNEGLIYEFRVQAISEKGEGPLSSPMRLQFPNGKTDEHKKDMYVVS